MLEEYKQLKSLLQDVEMDLIKANTGNAAAGRRARRKLKSAKRLTHSIIKGSLDVPKNTSPRQFHVFGPHLCLSV